MMNSSHFKFAFPKADMTNRLTPRISKRKEPKQARSVGLVSDILQAAGRVLAEEGAQRFTTARVAEKAGVSVGSLYQYFPNKASILFRLQAEEWRSTTELLDAVLNDLEKPPLDRLRAAVEAFVYSECEEAEMRLALGDAAPFYRDTPEAEELRASGPRPIHAFIDKVMPRASAKRRDFVGNMILMTLSTMGKRISEQHYGPDDCKQYAAALADMLCAYIKNNQ
jgi:AcrR family transcriptional regulator